MLSFCLLISFLLVQVTSSATLYCTTVQDIYLAMVTVQAGDEIVIAPGVYVADGLAISGSGAHFASYIDGTEQAPIVMRSEDVDNQAVLKGENAGSLSCVRIFGAFWRIQNLVVTNAQKGIVFDNAPFGEVIGCTIFGVGYEAIHWRDGSDFGLIDSCRIYDTGIRNPGFGEAIYIGTDKASWDKYDRDVTYVTIRNCDIGPGIAAEAFDIKEGTEEIIVEYNTIDATGISNANYADSFVDLKGTRAYIRYNTFRRNNEEKLSKGIAVIDRGVELSSYEHVIHDNYFELDDDGSNINMVDAYSGTSDIYAWNNVRMPAEGDTYSSSINDFCCPPWYSPPDDGTCFAPLYLEVSKITTTSVSLSWSGGTSAVSYTLAYASPRSTIIEEVNGLLDETTALQDLLVDTIYTARIKAICEMDSSAFSAQVAFRTLSNETDPNDPPAPSPQDGVVVIYGDGLAYGWAEFSYTGRYDLDHSIFTREGLYAIKATFGSYGGLQLKHNGLTASSFSYLHFWIRDDATNGSNSPDIQLEVNSMEYEFKIESPGWHPMTVPIQGNTVSRIVFQNRSPNQRTVYFDAIELWPEINEDPISSFPSLSDAIPSWAPVELQLDMPSTAPAESSMPSRAISHTPSKSISLVPIAPLPTFSPSENPVESLIPSSFPFISTSTPIAVTLSPVSQTLSPVIGHNSEVVYGDDLGADWVDYSFKGTFQYGDSNVVYDGGSAIRADFNGWGALHIKNVNSLDTAGFTSLNFILMATGNMDSIRVKINGKPYDVSLLITDEWTEVVLPLSVFWNPSSIYFVTFQNKSSSARTVYFDCIRFI